VPDSKPPAQSSLRPTSMAPAEDKASRFKRVEQLLQRGRPDEALTEAEALCAADPNDVELMALRAQALFEKHQVNPEGIPRPVLDAIKKALDADPEQPRALYIKGLVFKRGGELKKAVAYFRQVLKVDPKHLDAQREIRLAKLRFPGKEP
jgi:tetratricopeptide (TPR) repeat protein